MTSNFSKSVRALQTHSFFDKSRTNKGRSIRAPHLLSPGHYRWLESNDEIIISFGAGSLVCFSISFSCARIMIR